MRSVLLPRLAAARHHWMVGVAPITPVAHLTRATLDAASVTQRGALSTRLASARTTHASRRVTHVSAKGSMSPGSTASTTAVRQSASIESSI